MRFLHFRLPRTPLGVAATLALALSVLGSSAHDHALDDGVEAEAQVCAVAGIAGVPAPDVGSGPGISTPPVLLRAVRARSLVAGVEAQRTERARAPPVHEFVAV